MRFTPATAIAAIAITATVAACDGGDEDPVESVSACVKEAGISVERDSDPENADYTGFVAELDAESGATQGEVVFFDSGADAGAFLEAAQFATTGPGGPVFEQRGTIAVTGLIVTRPVAGRKFFDQLTACAEEAG